MRDPGGGRPSALHAGDRVAVVAPSGPVDPERLERGCAVLADLGFEVVVGAHVDVTEAPYRVDRMLTQLLQAGWFDGVAGVALGTWIDCGDPAAVFADRLMPLGTPFPAGLPVGHGPRQLTIRLGAPALLDADALVLHQDAPERRDTRAASPGAFAGGTP